MRRIITFLLLAILPLCAFARRHKDNTRSLRDSIVMESTKHLGKKYQYAGKGPNRFDCSGFTGYVFRQFGYELAASSASQYLQGDKISVEDAKKGDLIFFKGSNAKSKGVGHVGIISEVIPDGKNTTLRFIHASISSGITIDNYPTADYYKIRFIGIKRIIGEEEPTLDIPEEQEKELPVVTPDKDEKQAVDTIPSEDHSSPEEEVNPKEENEPQPVIKPIVERKDTLFHIVQKKETLFKISKKYGCTVEDLMRWNHLHDTYLKLGQKLYIQQEEEVKREPHPQNIPSDEATCIEHTVQPKETLYRISKIYGCTVEQIQAWNHLKGTALKIGQNLIIIRKE